MRKEKEILTKTLEEKNDLGEVDVNGRYVWPPYTCGVMK
jgi:hypothetical protein